jgi:hypothetical protein
MFSTIIKFKMIDNKISMTLIVFYKYLYLNLSDHPGLYLPGNCHADDGCRIIFGQSTRANDDGNGQPGRAPGIWCSTWRSVRVNNPASLSPSPARLRRGAKGGGSVFIPLITTSLRYE